MTELDDSKILTFEWESINYPLVLTNVKAENGFYEIPLDSVIKIWRDSQFDLKAEISGKTNNIKNLDYKYSNNAIKPGEFVQSETLICTNADNDKFYYKLKGCHLGNLNTSPNYYSETKEYNFRVELLLSEIIEEKNNYKEKQIDALTEWFLCENIDLLFPRTTERFSSDKYLKQRIPPEERIELTDDNIRCLRESSRDFFYIEFDNYGIIVQSIKKEYLPNWAFGIAIEYNSKYGIIPELKQRIAISEIISFVLGVKLVYIGSTELNSQQESILRRAISPWGNNIIARCSSTCMPPIKFANHKEYGKIEIVLNALVPEYLNLRENLVLESVLWKFWLARDAYVGTNLPILSSALESLAEAYLKFNKLITKPSKTLKKEYNYFLKHQSSFIEELWKFEFGKRLINKLENPFNLGVNEKLTIFFETIGITIERDSIENKALIARNFMTHSTLKTNPEEVKKALKFTRAYETFFSRILLKILGYKGNYIDYYTLGFPERDIEENISII